MRQEIQTYIRTTFSPEKLDLIEECFDTLEKYSLEDYDLQFLELLMEVDSKDQFQAQLEFETLVKNNLMNLCFVQGVTLFDETELRIINEVASCLIQIQNYEIKQEILDIIGIDFTTEEKLAELFQLVSAQSVESFLLAIEEVKPGIFVKLREINTENITIENDIENKEYLIDRLKALKQFLQSEDFIGFKLIKYSASVGLKFEHYFLYLKNKIEDYEIEKASKELFVLLNISSDTYKSILEEYSKRSENIFMELDKISKVNINLIKLHNDFDLFYKDYLNRKTK